MKLFHARSGIKNRRDGRSAEPEYLSWVRMQRRCYEPKYKQYKDYGGRGIRVCDAWRSDYLTFIRDMGRKPTPSHSLDRIDNDGDYEPKNCRWATTTEQSRNRRGVRKIKFKGEARCLSEWAEIIGINRSTLRNRLARLPVQFALDPNYTP